MTKPVTEVLADEVMFHVGSGKTEDAVLSILDALDLGGYAVVEKARLDDCPCRMCPQPDHVQWDGRDRDT